MSEDRDYAGGDEKERSTIEDKDVEGHAAGIERASDDEKDEPDVEGHTMTPQTLPGNAGIE